MNALTLTAPIDTHHGRPVMDTQVTRAVALEQRLDHSGPGTDRQADDACRIALVALALA